MKKIINPCSCEVYRGTASAFVSIEYDEEGGRLSLHGVVGPMSNGDCKGSAGQCVDEIRNGTPANVWAHDMLQKLCDIWDRWHMNDMRPYCQHQKELGWDTLPSALAMSTTTCGRMLSTPYSKSTTGSETRCSKNEKGRTMKMMDLYEAITHARDVAEGKHPNIDGCSEFAAQHAQLAEWLEELRWHRDLYKTDPECILVFSERRKLADAFTVWAEQNGIAQIPESVIAYLLSEGLLNVNKCKHLISKRGEKP